MKTDEDPTLDGSGDGSAAGGLLAAGQEALGRAAWAEARACFEAELARRETPEVQEALSWSCWWQDDFEPLIRAREAAFRLYRRRQDSLGAARMAMWLAVDHCDFRGEAAIANGWFRRAESLLEPLPLAPEHGWLRLIEADTALTLAGDLVTASRAAAAAAAIGREFGDVDCTMMALAVQGFALISEGDVAAGIQCLDEAAAAATGGELTRQSAPIWILCYLIYSCELLRDFDRAAQWCEKMREVADRLCFLFPKGICRVHYAGVLILRGRWAEAESELAEAETMFSVSRPPWIAESRVRLGELRRRQGNFKAAEAIFHDLEWHPLALLGLAALALDQHRPQDAEELCARLLRQLPDSARYQRVDAWELKARAAAQLGEHRRAAEALIEIEALTEKAATLPLRAGRSFSAAQEAVAIGDLEQARVCLEDSVALFDKSRAPYETARARLELAGVLVSLGRLAGARVKAEKARDGLVKLGAHFEAGRARAFLARIEQLRGKDGEHSGADKPLLTARQSEILRLVADGRGDRDIGAALGLSEHTVHRHVANVLTRLAVPSRAAAVAYAIAHNLI
jgi:LuxR family transcriptional regulator, maltose regulon positive regulatory protein